MSLCGISLLAEFVSPGLDGQLSSGLAWVWVHRALMLAGIQGAGVEALRVRWPLGVVAAWWFSCLGVNLAGVIVLGFISLVEFAIFASSCLRVSLFVLVSGSGGGGDSRPFAPPPGMASLVRSSLWSLASTPVRVDQVGLAVRPVIPRSRPALTSSSRGEISAALPSCRWVASRIPALITAGHVGLHVGELCVLTDGVWGCAVGEC